MVVGLIPIGIAVFFKKYSKPNKALQQMPDISNPLS